MYLNNRWRILTVGDGDLSFTQSLLVDKHCSAIVASCLDSEQALCDKYQNNSLKDLRGEGIPVYFETDILRPNTFSSDLKHQFDLVIFQFPLLPNNLTKILPEALHDFSRNVLNRLLIHRFINSCATFFLDPGGINLCYVTSKDVKPYNHWDLENIDPLPGGFRFQGTMTFAQQDFAHYRIRNVDRDKCVNDTKGLTYIWSKQYCELLSPFISGSAKHRPGNCYLCGAGPFQSDQQKQQHQLSKRHLTLLAYDNEWQSLRRQLDGDDSAKEKRNR